MHAKGITVKKLTTALATVGVASTMVMAAGVTTPAAAAQCNAYPPGSKYRVEISPPSKTVRPNSAGVRAVVIHAFTHRGDTVCPGGLIQYQYAPPGQSFRNYGKPLATNSEGKADITVTVPYSFTARWVYRPTPNTIITSDQVKIYRG